MRSLIAWHKPALKLLLLIAIVLIPSVSVSCAQSSLNDQQRRYTPEQWQDLQEFAKQFRDDPSLLPPDEDYSSVPAMNQVKARIPSQNASFRRPFQQEQAQDQDSPNQDEGNQPSNQDQEFDPFKSLRDPDPSSQGDSDIDPSPDPPIDDRPNQKPPGQEPDQGNPFGDDRAVDKLRELDQPRTQGDRRPPQPFDFQRREPLPPRQPVDESVIQQWEQPPGAVDRPEGNTRIYQQRSQTLPPQPNSMVTPYPYQPERPPVEIPNNQPFFADQAYPPQNAYPEPPEMGSYPADQNYGYQDQSGWQPANGQAGRQNFFTNPSQQWGVAGVEPCYDNACGRMGCEFECEIPEFYLSGYGMGVDLRNLVSGDRTLLADNGGGFGLAIGQRQGRNLRTELEYAWRSNSILGFTEAGLDFDITGKIKSQVGMANAYWEFVNFPTRCLKPYVGAGLGFSRFAVDLRDDVGSLTPQRSKDSAFAYQFTGGVNFQPTSYMDWFIEYRLFRTDSFQIDTTDGTAAGRYDYEANNLIGGLRWKF